MIASEGWLLALDLSTPGGILVLEGPGGLFQRAIEGDSRVSQLFVAAGETMYSAAITPGDLGLIGVGRGPGSFTGVRVAVMAAKTLALVLGVPLVAPDSLEVAAMGAEGRAEAVLVVLDARRGEVYYGLYDLKEGYPAVLEGPCVAPPQVVLESLSARREQLPERTVILGTGVDAYPDIWPRDAVMVPGDARLPEGLQRLCRRRAARGEMSTPMELLPLYVRRPDVRGRFSRGKEGGG